jgi:hypothetical protein
MPYRRSILFATALSALALWGCGSSSSRDYAPDEAKPLEAASLKPGEETKLFPLKEGNQWTYVLESASRVGSRQATGTAQMTFSVKKVTPKDDGVVAQIEVKTDAEGNKPDIQTWAVNSRGIFQISVGNPPVSYSPMQPVVLFPLDPERKFSWKGTGLTPAGPQGASQVDSKVLAPQEVDGATERFSAFPVESKGTFSFGSSKGQMASLAYWAPNVGLVRYRHEVMVGDRLEAMTLKLKAKTLR